MSRDDAMSMLGMDVARVASLHPDRPAVVSPHGCRSFAELNRRANQLVRHWRSCGLREGDCVALLCSNRPEFAEVVSAVMRSGVVMVPVNWHLPPEDVAYVVADCGARALVAEGRFAEAAGLAARESGRLLSRLSVDAPIEGFSDYAVTLSGERGDDVDDPSLGRFMLYTSGTTGRPKGVVRRQTPEEFVQGHRLFAAFFGFDPEAQDMTLATAPLYHGGPLEFVLRVPLASGIPVYLMDEWEAEEMLRIVHRHGITHTFCVPTMFRRLLALPEAVRRAHDLSSLRFVMHGGAPTPVADKHAMIEWLGPILMETYGSSEGIAVLIDSREWLKRPGSVGRPAPDSVLIAGEHGEPLPPGETGTLYMKPRGGGRFQYFKAPEKTREAVLGDFVTAGDIGHLDEEGYLFLSGRSAELVICGGANVYPAEADEVLLAHPRVADAAAFGVPDEEWGEVLAAVVVLEPGARDSAELRDDVLAHCRGRLGAHRSPKRLEVVDEVLRSAAGKILRRELQASYASRNSGA
ncbi:MAG: AMP-binding protein [Deltaproteobacteria bacterium]|nr:AMP-binding protein [Deltaproteobacteria bacterium]MBW2418211.1 AMP-binding protein [Deltaproteobacteria bacterium]